MQLIKGMEIDWNLVNANFIRRQLERCTVSTVFQFKFMINLYSLHRLNRTNIIKSGDQENFKDIQFPFLKGYFHWKTNSTFISIPCNWTYTYNNRMCVCTHTYMYLYILVYIRAYVYVRARTSLLEIRVWE